MVIHKEKSRSYLFVYTCIFTVAVWTQNPFTPLLTRPQGSQGCQKIRIIFLQIKVLSSCAKIAQKRHKLQKSSKLKEKCQKTLFSQTFSNILQFGGNLSAPNLKWHVQQILVHLLTPLAPLVAHQQWRYQLFSICF